MRQYPRGDIADCVVPESIKDDSSPLLCRGMSAVSMMELSEEGRLDNVRESCGSYLNKWKGVVQSEEQTTAESLEMCMCLKDHLDAQERKQHTSTLENALDFEDEVLDAEMQENEATPLSDEEIALDAAS
ncbi:hypothetical protein Tco_1289897 [Tanacetum coccineum]